jgi:hypothetical protein
MRVSWDCAVWDDGRCQLGPSVQIKLNEQDTKRARQIAQYPWFVNKKPCQKEIELMLKNDFKLEVEALISKDISYVTEEYVPARLEEREFLDWRIFNRSRTPDPSSKIQDSGSDRRYRSNHGTTSLTTSENGDGS